MMIEKEITFLDNDFRFTENDRKTEHFLMS